jgi:hypothetical protein
MIRRVFLWAAVISAFLLVGVSSARPQKEKNATILTLCDLVGNEAIHDRQTVSVRAFYLVGAEQALLYDPQCRNGEYLTYVDFMKLKDKFPKKLKQLEKTDRRALVIFEGIFYGPETVEIDPKLPQYLKDKLAGSKRQYGHMNSLETMIEVTRIKQVEKVPPDVPR